MIMSDLRTSPSFPYLPFSQTRPPRDQHPHPSIKRAFVGNPANALSWKEVPKDLGEWRNRDPGVLSGAASVATPPLIRYLNADSFKGSLFVVILLLNCT